MHSATLATWTWLGPIVGAAATYLFTLLRSAGKKKGEGVRIARELILFAGPLLATTAEQIGFLRKSRR